MGRRGPKPVDIGLLNVWEFEWYKVFHLLRDGTPLPYPYTSQATGAPPLNISRAQVHTWVRRLKGMDDEEWLKINEETCKEISRLKGSDEYEQYAAAATDRHVSLWWASGQRQQEIAELETYLNPKKIAEDAERTKLWDALWQARTIPALTKVCDEWASLRDVRAQGLVVFPNHVLANAREFLRMKQDMRFPKSDSPAVDESRLEYLARGMAGILANVSPMTGIERLRNMKHTRGGPLWKKEPDGREYCSCWRCGLDRARPAYKFSAVAWWNGMAFFMEVTERQSKQEKRRDHP
jgi:hypothetical protein